MKVRDVIAALKNYREDQEIYVSGPDSGGWDVCDCAEATIGIQEDGYLILSGFDTSSGQEALQQRLHGLDNSTYIKENL